MSRNATSSATAEPQTGPSLAALPGNLQLFLGDAMDAKATPERRFRALHELLTFGYIDKVKEIANTLPASTRRTARIARLEQVETGERLLQHVIPEIETEIHPQLGRKITGIMVLPSPEPTPFAVVFFGGNGDRNFTLPHQLFNRKHVHLIFLRDGQRCFSMCEIERLGPTYETNLSRLKLILSELEATSVYCLGVSAGAYPAIKFGLDLEAQSVLAFSGTPSLKLEDDPGATMAKYPQLMQIYKKARHLALNMAEEYAKSPTHPSVTMVYGEKNKRDAFFASGMPGVAGVKTVPINGFSGHGTFTESISRDIFSTLLDELFIGERVSEPASAYAY